jgi:hypothetical protein
MIRMECSDLKEALVVRSPGDTRALPHSTTQLCVRLDGHRFARVYSYCPESEEITASCDIPALDCLILRARKHDRVARRE